MKINFINIIKNTVINIEYDIELLKIFPKSSAGMTLPLATSKGSQCKAHSYLHKLHQTENNQVHKCTHSFQMCLHRFDHIMSCSEHIHQGLRGVGKCSIARVKTANGPVQIMRLQFHVHHPPLTRGLAYYYLINYFQLMRKRLYQLTWEGGRGRWPLFSVEASTL